MRKKCYLAICLATVMFIVGSLSMSRARELSESEKFRVQTIVSAFKTNPSWAMGLLEDFAKEAPELAAIVILELAKTTPEVAVMVVKSLAKTSPKVVVRGLLAVVSASIKLAKTKPKMAKALQAMLMESVVQMVEKTPDIAARTIVSIGKVSPEVRAAVEEEAVAAGLEKSYLTAASPVMP